jgi:hypothetical protein
MAEVLSEQKNIEQGMSNVEAKEVHLVLGLVLRTESIGPFFLRSSLFDRLRFNRGAV